MDAFPLPVLDDEQFVATEEISVAELSSALEDARAEADAIRAAAHAEGRAMGRADAEAQMQPALLALQDAVNGIGAERAALAESVESAAVELAMSIAEQVLGGALEVRPELVTGVVRGALRLATERDRLIVLVNPDDLDVVRGAMPALAAELGGIEHFEVRAERRMARGGARVSTAEGEVDATLATKLELVRAAVAESLAGPGE